MRLRSIALATLLALFAHSTNAFETDPVWNAICSAALQYPVSLATFAPADIAGIPPCGPAASQFRQLPSVGGLGDTSVALNIGYDHASSRLCFVNKTLTEAPVLRVGAGHTLTFNLTNTLLNTGPSHSLNCDIQDFGGEGLCVTRPQFKEAPGPDGPYYPIEANQQHTANGLTNLHTHGLFVSPQPCSDEVLKSTIYPANWVLPVAPLQPCQTAPDTLTYTYNLPSDHPAGAYWYHTHHHGTAEQQTQMGLVGAIVVEDAGDAHRASIGVTDQVLVVTDTPLKACVDGPVCDALPRPAATLSAQQATRETASRQSAATTSAATGPVLDPRIDEVDQAGGCAAGAAGAAGGYQLWTILLNGAPVLDAPGGNWPPDDELLSTSMHPGQRQIFRLINSGADTFLAPQLVLKQDGVETPLPLEVFARDGVGLADAQGNRHITNFNVATTPLIIPPAGRVEFVVHAPPVGATLYLDSNQVYPGCGGNQYPPRRMLVITSAGTPLNAGDADDSDLLIGSAPLPSYIPPPNVKPTVTRTMVFTEYSRAFTYSKTKWLSGPPTTGDYDPNQVDFYLTQVAINGKPAYPKSEALTPFSPQHLAPEVVVHLHGQDSVTEQWLVENATLEMHAFHMHQVHFRDVTVANTNPDLQPVLDTEVVPPAQLVGDIATGYPGAPGWIKLNLTFTKADIGEFVFHCHILEHEDNGMMATIQVVAD